MKCLRSCILGLWVIAAPVGAQTSTSVKCPCDFSGESFTRLLGGFVEGSVSCTTQSGVKVGTTQGKQHAINTLSTRVLVLNKQSYTPGGWLLEYYSSEYAPPMGLGSFCASSMGAALNQSKRKEITRFAEYQACLSDITAALKTVKVYCNQVEAVLPDPPKNAKAAPSSGTFQDMMNALPLKQIPLQQPSQPRSE